MSLILRNFWRVLFSSYTCIVRLMATHRQVTGVPCRPLVVVPTQNSWQPRVSGILTGSVSWPSRPDWCSSLMCFCLPVNQQHLTSGNQRNLPVLINNTWLQFKGNLNTVILHQKILIKQSFSDTGRICQALTSTTSLKALTADEDHQLFTGNQFNLKDRLLLTLVSNP